jgi:hypothetical protein
LRNVQARLVESPEQTCTNNRAISISNETGAQLELYAAYVYFARTIYYTYTLKTCILLTFSIVITALHAVKRVCLPQGLTPTTFLIQSQLGPNVFVQVLFVHDTALTNPASLSRLGNRFLSPKMWHETHILTAFLALTKLTIHIRGNLHRTRVLCVFHAQLHIELTTLPQRQPAHIPAQPVRTVRDTDTYLQKCGIKLAFSRSTASFSHNACSTTAPSS